jgi:hypothetical protein
MNITSLKSKTILIISLFLIINSFTGIIAQNTFSTQNISNCKQYIWPINGKTYSSSGTYKDTIPNAKNFDSIITLNLIIYPAKTNTIFKTECSKFTWSATGLTYNQSGVYKANLKTNFNCDSIVTLNLTIKKPTFRYDTVDACESYKWPLNNRTYNKSGDYYDTLINKQGCDSVVSLNLTINYIVITSQKVVACKEFIWPVNNQKYTQTGEYKDTLKTIHGCDSLIFLRLHVNQPTFGIENQIACDQFYWKNNGLTYTQSGTYKDTLFNTVGCDSIVTLNLTIKKSTRNSISVTSCNNYSWWQNGKTYKKSGNYYDTILNAVGCDSIVELKLTIISSFDRTESMTTCTKYTWKVNNQTYFKSGKYSHIVKSKNTGVCDSIYYLNLTISNTLYGKETIRTCESYKWPANNVTYKSSGVYTAKLKSLDGCDSIVKLYLTISKSKTTYINKLACVNYTWDVTGKTYYFSDDAIKATLQSAAGCDSIVYLNLVIKNVDATATVDGLSVKAKIPGLEYQWIDCEDGNAEIKGATRQIYTPITSGKYAVIVKDYSCSNRSDCFSIEVPTNSINSKENEQFKVYPNPFNDQINIEFKQTLQNANIEIKDLSGKSVYKENFKLVDKINIPLEIPSGMYLIEIRNNQNYWIQKITK